MANITKVSNPINPANQRYLQILNTEVANGDVVRVSNSLGKPAVNLSIVITGDGLGLKVKLNSRQLVLKKRVYPETQPFGWVGQFDDLYNSAETTTGAEAIDIAVRGAGTYNFNNFPISDVEIVKGAGTGTFTLIFS